jgi:quercetin dioxygenase-like cupin family protein
MKHSHSWLKGELMSMILLNRPDKKILLTAMHVKTEINSFQSTDSITFQILEGKLKFHTRKETVILSKGQILTLIEKIEYCLTAMEETVFLLTISPTSLNRQKS